MILSVPELVVLILFIVVAVGAIAYYVYKMYVEKLGSSESKAIKSKFESLTNPIVKEIYNDIQGQKIDFILSEDLNNLDYDIDYNEEDKCVIDIYDAIYSEDATNDIVYSFRIKGYDSFVLVSEVISNTENDETVLFNETISLDGFETSSEVYQHIIDIRNKEIA